MNLKLIRRNLLLGSAFVISGVVGGGYGRGAYAACLAGPSPTYICSGNNAVTQSILNVTDATVSTVPGFERRTCPRPPAMASKSRATATSASPMRMSQTLPGPPTAFPSRAWVELAGGSVTVDVTGDVTGATRDGIYARNNTGGTSLTVTTGEESAITGNVTGIAPRTTARAR